MMKATGFAATAVDATFALRLASNGFPGPTGTLERFAARSHPAKTTVAVDLDPRQYRLPKVALKRVPIQLELAAIAEGTISLAPRVRGRVSQILAIEVETCSKIIERVADLPKFHPLTRGITDHSLPVCLAMALVDGDVNERSHELPMST